MRAGWVAFPVSIFAVLSACDGVRFQLDCTDAPGICEALDGGAEGGGDGVAPLGCDLARGPKESPACVDESVGVFVSARGDDGAAGTKSEPVRSIGKGLEVAAERGVPRVYVCEGKYDAGVEL
ncbi:MAG TPA: hypothetical protein VM580_29900, partial [Labilithrix sp.]|nr:hypothetical protein [Labilithrix sp.]